MNRRQKPAAFPGLHYLLVALSFVSAGQLRAAQPLVRPLSARGEAARTLIVFSTARSAYSLGDELEFLKLQLERVATRLEAVPFSQATSNKLAEADYLVVFCPQPDPVVGTNLLQNITGTARPILWVGYGTEQLTNLAPFAGQFEPALIAGGPIRSVNYRGRDWSLSGEFWIPMRLTTDSTAQVIMSRSHEGDKATLPVCWKVGDVTCFSGVPAAGPLTFLFADIVLDFYGATNIPEPRIFFRIDDYQAASNHREFRRWVDYLFSRGHPFLLSVTPSWKNPETGVIENLDSAPDFVTGLRYAQRRGGRLVLRGCVRESGGRGEFWDTELDRPLPQDQVAAFRDGLGQAAGLLLKHGLFPLAWQTPHDAASHAAYNEIVRVFSTGVERPQLSDRTHLEKGLVSALTADRSGRQIVPENLGYVSSSATNVFEEIKRRAEFLTSLHGTLAGGFIHAYQPFGKLTGLLDTLEALKTPFLDLAELDNWVYVPGHLLLTGNAQHKVKLAGGTVTWKAFDRGGKLVAAEQESAATAGERVFKRKGNGEYELFEFTEATP